MIIDAAIYDSNSNNYAESEIREWLNNDFYNTAFNDLQKEIINTVLVDNSARSTNPDNNAMYWNSGKNNYASSNTSDKVWLLSVQEVTNIKYEFDSSLDNYNALRQKSITDFGRVKNIFIEDAKGYIGNGWWWLRSPYYANSKINFDCGTYGNVVNRILTVNSVAGIAPALRISFE